MTREAERMAEVEEYTQPGGGGGGDVGSWGKLGVAVETIASRSDG